MQDERDYYSILGVSANAPDMEIRRAFRARAKELHPDSKPAGEREQAHREFNLLTEAYETLKDAERRRDYDEAMRASRQLARIDVQSQPPGAFAIGLTFGLVLTGFAVGAWFFMDQAGRDTAKNQDSLRAVRLQPPPAPVQAPPMEAGQSAAVRAAAPRYPAAPSSQRLAPAPELAEPAPDRDQTRIAAREPSPDAPDAGASAPASGGSTAAQDRPRQTRAPHTQFARELLALENQTSSDMGGVAMYRLVSLVNSWSAIDELSEAAALASKPETANLIWARIALLKEQQQKQLASVNTQQQEAAAKPPSAPQKPAAGAPAKPDTALDVATGDRTAQTILRLHPGSGLQESFSDCPACPEMVMIPAGQTLIGSRPESAGYRPEEGPAHKVTIRKPFAVSKYGISAGNWRACVDAGICRPILASYLSSGPGVPATRVSWFDAKTFTEWLSRSSGRHYRLLSEAEWEYMAQAAKEGGTAHKFGTLGSSSAASSLLRLNTAGLKHLGDTKPNGWGIHPMPASLLEWVEDCWHPNYRQAPQDGAPWLSSGGGDCGYRVVRGVSATGGDFGGRRLSGRARETADARSPALGFRIARDLDVLSKTAFGPRGATRRRALRGQ
jgi:formylglycine-generating enzyme required for sulfatase activity/curved DNA-binding protein CbpA